MDFEWDAAKETTNLEKHGIDFVDAVKVFNDPHHLEEDSSRLEHGEQRYRAIGMVADLLFTVIFTDRQDRRRIISARRARRNERERYNQSKAAQ
jgi:uncharacterized protein